MQIPHDEDLTLKTSQPVLSAPYLDDDDQLFELLKEPVLHSITGTASPESVHALAQRIAMWESRHSPSGDEG
jgi:hypothetical protein